MKKADPYYKTRAWQLLRKAALRRDLYTCVVPGCGQPAYAVDHIKARRAGGADALWNLRSLCKAHDHAVKETSTGERGNAGMLVVKGCFADGSPRDPSHPWFTGGPGGGSNTETPSLRDRRPPSKHTYLD
jgi:5-methylcytosine-specific restriction endonuclease McrA